MSFVPRSFLPLQIWICAAPVQTEKISGGRVGCWECGTGHGAGEFGVQPVEFVVIFTQHRASFLEFALLLGVALTPEMFPFKMGFNFSLSGSEATA